MNREPLYFCYDGSLNGDWVAQYAVTMAALTGAELKLVHVLDGKIPERKLSEKIAHLRKICKKQKVLLEENLIPLAEGSVFDAICGAIPDSAWVISGSRIRLKHRGILKGTISEKILKSGKYNAIVFRVVQPAIAGKPRKILFPVSGHPRGLTRAKEFIRMITDKPKEVFILRVVRLGRWQYKYLSEKKALALKQEATQYVLRAKEELARDLELPENIIEGKAVLAPDWESEVLAYAARVKADLIMIGSPLKFMQTLFYGSPVEHLLRDTPCDVAVYRSIEIEQKSND